MSNRHSPRTPEMSDIMLAFDDEVQALYVRLSDAPVVRTLELSDTVSMDVDSQGRAVGLEILDAHGELLDRLRLEHGGAALSELMAGLAGR